MIKIESISISKEKGVPKDNVNEAKLIKDHGIKGDAHAKNWHRQISLLGVESIDKMRKKGAKGLRNGIFAENITTSGIELYSLNVGDKLLINETELEVTQIGKECHHHCEIYKQIGDCVMPREGIFVKVNKGGDIKVDDSIELIKI